jgi:hypothetical protein
MKPLVLSTHAMQRCLERYGVDVLCATTNRKCDCALRARKEIKTLRAQTALPVRLPRTHAHRIARPARGSTSVRELGEGPYCGASLMKSRTSGRQT